MLQLTCSVISATAHHDQGSAFRRCNDEGRLTAHHHEFVCDVELKSIRLVEGRKVPQHTLM